MKNKNVIIGIVVAVIVAAVVACVIIFTNNNNNTTTSSNGNQENGNSSVSENKDVDAIDNNDNYYVCTYGCHYLHTGSNEKAQQLPLLV